MSFICPTGWSPSGTSDYRISKRHDIIGSFLEMYIFLAVFQVFNGPGDSVDMMVI
jgi:hypothetical protein